MLKSVDLPCMSRDTRSCQSIRRERNGLKLLVASDMEGVSSAKPNQKLSIMHNPNIHSITETYGFPPGTPAVGPPLTPLGGKTEAGNLGSTPGKGGRGGKAPGRPGGTPFW